MSIRKPSFIRKSGPYSVTSRADGTLIVEPSWSQFVPWTEETGGGPGLVSRMGLAFNIERWLNGETVAEAIERRQIELPARLARESREALP